MKLYHGIIKNVKMLSIFDYIKIWFPSFKAYSDNMFSIEARYDTWNCESYFVYNDNLIKSCQLSTSNVSFLRLDKYQYFSCNMAVAGEVHVNLYADFNFDCMFRSYNHANIISKASLLNFLETEYNYILRKHTVLLNSVLCNDIIFIISKYLMNIRRSNK